ncbi:MAG TPA: Gfo/Idh/MocA family oxidoreductase [Chloroflexota bacterium]
MNPNRLAHSGRDRRPIAGPVRVALLGLGGAAERILLPALRTVPRVEIVGGCDPDVSARERAVKEWRIPQVYKTPQELLDNLRPAVALVATPPLTHPDLCLLALDRGCHVFCEKPFMPSIETADRVIEAARSANRLVAVDNQYYQMPIYQKVKQVLQSGQVGRLYNISVWQHMQLLPAEEGGWKSALQPHRVLYEFGTHALDLVCQFFGDYPISVTARTPRVRAEVDADVLVVLRLDFPGDRIATLVFNRISHAPKKYLEMRLDCDEGSIRASLGGVARLDIGWNSELGRPRTRFSLTAGGEARLERDGNSRLLARQPRNAFHGASAAHFAQFLSAINEGVEPAVSAAHAREVLRVVFAGYDSAANGGDLVKLRADDLAERATGETLNEGARHAPVRTARVPAA